MPCVNAGLPACDTQPHAHQMLSWKALPLQKHSILPIVVGGLSHAPSMQVPPGKLPFFSMPIFHYHEARSICWCRHAC